MFLVNVGFTETGRARNRRFSTLDEARAFVSRAFDRTGVVLSIVECAK